MHFAADSILTALDVAAQAHREGQPLVVPDGPDARRRSGLLEELVERGWIDVEGPNHGDDRLISIHRARLTAAGAKALASRTTPAEPGTPPEATMGQGHPFSPLADDVRTAVAVLWSAFQADREWPIYEYLDRVLDERRMSVNQVLSSMPRIGAMGAYGPLWSHAQGGVAQPDSPIGATVAGLAQLPECAAIIDAFLGVIRSLAARLRAVPLNRRQPQSARLRFSDLVGLIAGETTSADLLVVEAVRALLEHEPPTWGVPLGGPASDSEWEIPRGVSRFHDVADADDYLERVVELLSPSPLQTPPVRTDDRPAAELERSTYGLDAVIDPGLWHHVADLVAIEKWDAVVINCMVYVEDMLRRLGGRTVTEHGLSLVATVLHPRTGSHPLGGKGHPEEAGGWHQLALGLFKAVRNAAGHRLDPSVDARYAFGVVGTASLLLTQMSRDHPATEM